MKIQKVEDQQLNFWENPHNYQKEIKKIYNMLFLVNLIQSQLLMYYHPYIS